MMDTILNLGLNDETVKGLAAKSGNERFAYDSYRRFIQMYSDVVLGVDHGVFEDILENHKNLNGYSLDTDLTADDWLRGDRRLQGRDRARDRQAIPAGSTSEQLWGAIAAVFGSWQNERANTYRRLHAIPDSWGTAVNVQAMVFGNLGDSSATGVAFTRNPSTGAREIYGEFLVNAQGEDVVAGIRTPQPLTEAARKAAGEKLPSLEALMPATYRRADRRVRQARGALPRHAGHRVHHPGRQALDAADALRQAHHQGRAQDRRRPVQRRHDRRRGSACMRVDADALDQLLHPTIDPAAEKHVLATRPAGIARRRLRRDRVRRRRGRDAERPGPRGHPGAHRDQPRGHPRHARRRRHPHHARRHDQPRRRGGARHGPALRVRRRHAAHRRQGRHHDRRRRDLPQGRRSSPSTAAPARS